MLRELDMDKLDGVFVRRRLKLISDLGASFVRQNTRKKTAIIPQGMQFFLKRCEGGANRMSVVRSGENHYDVVFERVGLLRIYPVATFNRVFHENLNSLVVGYTGFEGWS